jgi:hypothetical protein
VTKSNQAYAAFNGGFYKVRLTTGDTTFVGKLASGVVDIAVPLNQ